jgi:hypothetical protein
MRWKRFSTWFFFPLGSSADGDPSNLRLLLVIGAGEAAGRVADESVEEPLRSAEPGVASDSESDELSEELESLDED